MRVLLGSACRDVIEIESFTVEVEGWRNSSDRRSTTNGLGCTHVKGLCVRLCFSMKGTTTWEPSGGVLQQCTVED